MFTLEPLGRERLGGQLCTEEVYWSNLLIGKKIYQSNIYSSTYFHDKTNKSSGNLIESLY